MKITWEVDDGYVSGARPHETIIDDEELIECSNIGEMEEVIEEAVQSDFEQNINWSLRNRDQIKQHLKEIIDRKAAKLKQELEEA